MSAVQFQPTGSPGNLGFTLVLPNGQSVKKDGFTCTVYRRSVALEVLITAGFNQSDLTESLLRQARD